MSPMNRILILVLAVLFLPIGRVSAELPAPLASLAYNKSEGPNIYPSLISRLSNGKILVAGGFSSWGNAPKSIVRLNQDGSYDTTFIPPTFSTGTIVAMAVQSNGGILIGGTFQYPISGTNYQLLRLNPNGSVDTTFRAHLEWREHLIDNEGNTIPGFHYYNPSVTAIIVRPDQKIVIGGNFNRAYGSVLTSIQAVSLARFTSTGVLDQTFNAVFSSVWTPYALKQSTDKLYAVGQGDGGSYGRVYALFDDGLLVPTFELNNYNGIVRTVDEMNGNILIGGDFSHIVGLGNVDHLQRRLSVLNENGEVQPDLSNYISSNSTIMKANYLPDGSIVAFGGFGGLGGMHTGVSHFYADGSFDYNLQNINLTHSALTNWNPPAYAGWVANGIWDEASGSIFIVGDFIAVNDIGRSHVAKLDLLGIVDVFFQPGVSTNRTANAFSFDGTGRLWIGGTFSRLFNKERTRIGVLGAGGQSVTELSENPTVEYGFAGNTAVHSIQRDPSGKMLVAGNFQQANGQPRGSIARFNLNGSLDDTFLSPSIFGPYPGALGAIYKAIPVANGKYIIAGSFTDYNGYYYPYFIRLDADGGIDVTFNNFWYGGPDGPVYDFASTPDGKIILVGNFTSYADTPCKNVIRVLPDGQIDPSFSINLNGDGFINAVAIDSMGRMLVGGSFTQIAGYNRKNLVRLLANGILDTSFTLGTGPDTQVTSIAIDSANRVYFGGTFRKVNDFTLSGFAMLSSMGVLMTDSPLSRLTYRSGTSPRIDKIQYDPSTRYLMVGGNFTQMNRNTLQRFFVADTTKFKFVTDSAASAQGDKTPALAQ